MINVTSKTKSGTTKIISLKPNETIVVELKPEQEDTMKLQSTYLRKYPNAKSFYADDAYIKDDTLYAYQSCYSCDSVKIPVDSILHAKISFEQIERKKIKKDGVWFAPSLASEINGLSVSLVTTTAFTAIDTLKINGLNLDIEPQWALLTATACVHIPFHFIGLLFPEKHKNIDTATVIKPIYQDCSRKCPPYNNSAIIINGVNLGIFGSPLDASIISGVNIAGLITIGDTIKGISITGLVTVSENVKGVAVSGLVNQTKCGRGVQIGLTNFAKDFYGIQIGLWNKIGKFGFPFLNLRFKKKKE
jgi:hypothetical protein